MVRNFNTHVGHADVRTWDWRVLVSRNKTCACRIYVYRPGAILLLPCDPKSSICLIFRQAVTAFRLCGKILFTRRSTCTTPSLFSNSRRWTNAGLMLGQRRRRWPSIKPALVQSLVWYEILTRTNAMIPHLFIGLQFNVRSITYIFPRMYTSCAEPRRPKKAVTAYFTSEQLPSPRFCIAVLPRVCTCVFFSRTRTLA